MTTDTLTRSIAQKSLFLMNFSKINLRSVWLSGFILMTLLLIFYIFQMSKITQVSFFISQYEREIVQLSQQNKNLEIVLSQAKSLSNLETILSRLDYEEVGGIYYLRVLEGTVLAK